MWIAVVVVVLLIVFAVVWKLGEPKRRRSAAVAKAVREAEAEVAARPHDPDAKARLAIVLMDLAGDGERAVKILDEVLAAAPYHWRKASPPSRFLLAHAHVTAGRLERGIAEYGTFLGSLSSYDTGGDPEMKWLLETHKVDAEQRVRLLKKGDTHIHKPEQWGDGA